MIFENGIAYCLDNGGLGEEYINKLTCNDKYHELDFDNKLTFTTKNGQEVSISVKKGDFTCLHQANAIYEKAKEFLEKKGTVIEKSLIDRIIEYYRNRSDEKPPLLRMSSLDSEDLPNAIPKSLSCKLIISIRNDSQVKNL